MLKSYAGKKILPIIEKATVEFFSVACCTYHCFLFFVLFLDLPLVMSDVDPMWT